MFNRSVLLLLISFSWLLGQSGQSQIKEGAPNIFFDCGSCDVNYIKEKISIVNYVTDRKDADVHILFTTQTNGSGGKEYTLRFIGQNKYQNQNDTIKFSTHQIDTQDIIREKIVKGMKNGLFKYILNSNVADKMNITYSSFSNEAQQNQNNNDSWDYWNFKINLSGRFNGEQNYSSLSLNNSITANRTTEDLKINLQISSNYSQSKYTYEMLGSTTNILNISRKQTLSGYIVKSIGGNWSLGLWSGINSSIYNNIEFSAFLSPGIEYNIFPYSVSNEKQLRINYKIAHTINKYDEETWYFKTEENLWSQNAEVTLALIREWGSVSFSATGANYLHDFSLYELGLDGNISLNLFKGFSLRLYGGYSKIENQITLRRKGASLEDVLTQRRQLATNYDYWGGFGVSYSFGSIYNNIVNPRFGSGNTSIIF